MISFSMEKKKKHNEQKMQNILQMENKKEKKKYIYTCMHATCRLGLDENRFKCPLRSFS